MRTMPVRPRPRVPRLRAEGAAPDARAGAYDRRAVEWGRSIDAVLLWAFSIAGLLLGSVLAAIGVLTGDADYASRAVGPAAFGGYSMVRAANDRSAFPVIPLGFAVIMVNILIDPNPIAFANSYHAVLALGLSGALLLDSRRVIMSWAFAGVSLLTAERWWLLDEPLEDRVLSAAVTFVVIMFGVRLIEYTKTEIRGKAVRFRNLFDHAPVAIWEEDFSGLAAWLETLSSGGVTDLRSYFAGRPDRIRYAASLINVVDANEAAVSLLEAESRKEMLGPLNADSIVQDTLDSLVEQYLAVWEGRAQLTIDVHGRTLRGNPIDGFLMLAAPTNGPAIDWGSVAIAIVDVSDLREAQRKLEELIDSKDQFIASVSHELRTPLTAVVGLAHELESAGTTITDAERTELVGLIADQASDVGNIVEDLLVAARADLGTIAIRPEPVDVEAEIRRLATMIYEEHPPVVDVSGPILAKADPSRLRQVLRNLLTNAQRYGGRHVEIAAFARYGQVYVEVRDNGDGIPAGLEDQVFEPYETAPAGRGVPGSVGLGLTVSRQLARLMGGDLSYDRTEERTVFRLALPAA